MEQYHFLVDFVTANFEHFFNALRIGKGDKAKTTKNYFSAQLVQLFCSSFIRVRTINEYWNFYEACE